MSTIEEKKKCLRCHDLQVVNDKLHEDLKRAEARIEAVKLMTNFEAREQVFDAAKAEGQRAERENQRVQITFGYGKVRMSKAKIEGSDHESILVLSEYPEGMPVGHVDENCPYIGKDSSTISGPKVELWFDNVQGLEALIKSLSELRQQMSERIIRGKDE